MCVYCKDTFFHEITVKYIVIQYSFHNPVPGNVCPKKLAFFD